MKRILITTATIFALASHSQAQLTLDSCITMALQKNYKVRIAIQENIAAQHTRKASIGNYFPHINAEALYLHSQKSLSLIDREQQKMLHTIGNLLQTESTNILQQIAIDNPALLPIIKTLNNASIAEPLNNIGHSIAEALTPDTRNIYTAAVTLTQPIYTGGKISAYNKITKLLEEISHNNIECTKQEIIEATEQTYWQIVSLANKEKLAQSYLELIKKLYNNVEKLESEGMATKSELLGVNVRLNEAKRELLRARNATTLTRMLLNTLCNLPQESHTQIVDELYNLNRPTTTTVDEEKDNILNDSTTLEESYAMRSLKQAVAISHQETKLIRADYLPQIGLSASYIMSNPSLTDGFRNRFGGVWNIGLELKIPIWNWNERKNKIRASRAKENIAQYTLDESREMLLLSVNQLRYKIEESKALLKMAISNTEAAEENLHSANISFAEGLLDSEALLAAQTAWLKAHTARIDAHIEVIMSKIKLKRALGILKKEL